MTGNGTGMDIPVETHPLPPFLPENARLLMLGSFPPKRERWSMDFFYPNFNNDMWRIFGIVFFGDKSRFIAPGGKQFDRDSVMEFCRTKGIALYDTATAVRRLKDNASDKFLEIVCPTDLGKLLGSIPGCRAIAVTGQKAAETAAEALGCDIPSPGNFITTGYGHAHGQGGFSHDANMENQEKYRLWRMPSSSRAYPLGLDRKAGYYRDMFAAEGLL